MNYENWATNYRTVTEKDINALNEKQRYEQKLIKKQNYKWYKINDKLSVLVPFDKEGNVTPKGKEIIKRYSNR